MRGRNNIGSGHAKGNAPIRTDAGSNGLRDGLLTGRIRRRSLLPLPTVAAVLRITVAVAVAAAAASSPSRRRCHPY